MAQLMCKNLSIGYGEHAVIQNLSFEVSRGEYLCVVGENGAGKSTLIRTILGLQRPLSGEIGWGEGLRANEIGYLPQQTDVQRDFPASVEEVVLSGCQNRCGLRPFYVKSEREEARKNMELLHIESLSGKCYRHLSGGQQKRVLLARALCATQRLLLLDEPVAGLDPMTSLELYARIREVNKEQGITIIMVTHDLAAALSSASHVLHLGQESAFFKDVRAYAESPEGKRFLGSEGGGQNG